jgi:hypothetical protein
MQLPNNDSLMKVINNTIESDFSLVGDFSRIDECSEILRLNGIGSVKDFPKPYVLNDKIFFGIKEYMIPFYVATSEEGKFKLYELSLKKYTELGF